MNSDVKPLLLVGLGNPGKKFLGTRHNVGFAVVDRVAALSGVGWVSRRGGDIEVVEVRGCDSFGGRDIVLLKPMTFMNCSGAGVADYLRKGRAHEVVVVHDDLDLVLGRVKIKHGGSDGGHRGLRSLDERIGRDYWRVRIGIGRGAGDVEGYVLGRFRGEEDEVMGEVIGRIAEGLGEMCGEALTAERAGVFAGVFARGLG